jgi:hypothetical protein
VVLRAPGKTVTARGPVEQRVVTDARTDTVVRTVRANRLTTVTTPGKAETVTREVTQPARTVTTPGTTETVTREVTQPARTVTQTDTERVTTTEQVRLTETVTVTVTCKKPC